MPISNPIIDYAQLQMQRDCVEKIRDYLGREYQAPPLALVHSYGCQQNVADGEQMQGLLEEMGYRFTESLADADLILYNTCGVRENAEERVFGNVGALKHYKRRKPSLIIALTGCMTQQHHVADRLRKSYPYVDIVAGSNAAAQLPQLLFEKLCLGRRHYDPGEPQTQIVEGLPTRREDGLKAWVPVMYGCDNFCSYCIVPYVRGRERSRRPGDVVREVQELVEAGYRDITLLGQNVNSYGKGLPKPINFAQLLRRINDLPGRFRVRFMTSHPKDCTRELIDAIADCGKVCNHLHLPVQSGSDRILEQMNRRYTAKQYLSLIEYAKTCIPGLTLSSDIIVGFPGETREDFEQTLWLVRQVEYASLYTFLYSPRRGTRAEGFADPVPVAEKSVWFRELLDCQAEIGQRVLDGYVGKTVEVLPESVSKNNPALLTCRTEGNLIVELPATQERIGSFLRAKIIQAKNWALEGREVDMAQTAQNEI